MVTHLKPYRNAIGTAPHSVVIESPAHWNPTGYQWSELVWMPLSPMGNLWHCDRLQRSTSYSTDNVDCRVIRGSYLAKCYEGEYIGPNLDNEAYSFPAGSWVNANYQASGLSYATIYTNNVSKYMQVAIPEGTTRVYMLADVASNAARVSMSLSGNGEVLYPTLKVGSANTGGSDYPSRIYEFDNWLLVARNCGGQTLTITLQEAATTMIGGFICCKDAPSNPYDGVMDPGTLINIMPKTQSALHPIQYKIGSGAPVIWGLGGHTTEYNTVLGGDEKKQYEIDGDITTWTPAARTNERVSVDQFSVRLKGTMAVDISSAAEGVAEYKHRMTWRGGELSIYNHLKFNANAVAQGYKWPGSSYKGGYCAQRGMEKRNWSARSIPAIGRTIVAPYDNRDVAASKSGVMLMEDHLLSVLLTAQTEANLVSGDWVPQGELSVIPRSLDDIAKFYAHWFAASTDLTVAENDEFMSMSKRVTALRNAL